MTTLSEMLSEQRASVIDWYGPLHSLVELPVDVSCWSVEFQSSASSFPQALRLKVRGGELTTNGVTAADLVLWRDSAPSRLEVDVVWGEGPRSLRAWNAWGHNGVMHAWLGNAGMRVDQVDPGAFVLRCSDGNGEPEFANLVVKLSAIISDA